MTQQGIIPNTHTTHSVFSALDSPALDKHVCVCVALCRFFSFSILRFWWHTRCAQEGMLVDGYLKFCVIRDEKGVFQATSQSTIAADTDTAAATCGGKDATQIAGARGEKTNINKRARGQEDGGEVNKEVTSSGAEKKSKKTSRKLYNNDQDVSGSMGLERRGAGGDGGGLGDDSAKDLVKENGGSGSLERGREPEQGEGEIAGSGSQRDEVELGGTFGKGKRKKRKRDRERVEEGADGGEKSEIGLDVATLEEQIRLLQQQLEEGEGGRGEQKKKKKKKKKEKENSDDMQGGREQMLSTTERKEMVQKALQQAALLREREAQGDQGVVAWF